MTASTELMWSDFSLANALNPAQRHRWRLIISEAVRSVGLSPGKVVADLGCGSGTLLMKLRERCPQLHCIGLEVEPLALDLARKALPSGEFHQVDLGAPSPALLKSIEGSADLVLCSEVLEHLENPAAAVDFAGSLLKPGGVLIVTVPSGPLTQFDRAIGHVRHYDLASLASLVQRGNLHTVRLYRWGFPFHSLFRTAVGLFRIVPSEFTDAKFGLPVRVAFRLLDWLFFFNLKSRWLGRQLVAVAVLNPSARTPPDCEGGCN